VAETSDPTDLPSHAQDLWQLVVGYVKQETFDPVRDVGRYVAFGLAGSALIGLGLAVLFLGVLRLLQEQTGDALDGHLSFVPYLITLVLCGAVAGGALKARGRKKEAT
jgi:hypothetical protein